MTAANHSDMPRDVRMLSVQQFRKTKMCPHMEKPEGCLRSMHSECPYAHHEGELKELPNLLKTAMCKLHLKRCCDKSREECPYAHTFEELRHTEGFYKTFVCKFWQRGHCRAGDMCRYAHGEHEIRNVIPTNAAVKVQEPSRGTTGAIPTAMGEIEVISQISAQERECNTPTVSSGYCFNHSVQSPMYVYPIYGEMNTCGQTPTAVTLQPWMTETSHLHSKEQEEAYCLMQFYLQKYIDCCSKQQAYMRHQLYLTPSYAPNSCYKN